MAKQRWATFSVEDHKDVTALIPDILTFDRLIFPYPRDDQERRNWETNGWQPALLDARLTDLQDLATPFEWGERERGQYQTRLAAAQGMFDLEVPQGFAKAERERAARRGNHELYLQLTRDTIGARINVQFGNDCWLLPRYGSLAALQAERSFVLAPEERERRRDRLTVLLGHELALPSSANAQRAYELAIELARDSRFQHARRALNERQELTVLQEQSGRSDAQAFADLVSDFNAQVTARTMEVRKGWIFTVLKAGKELAEFVEKPFSSLFGAALEVAETATNEEHIPPGPIAVFHHTKRRVFDRV